MYKSIIAHFYGICKYLRFFGDYRKRNISNIQYKILLTIFQLKKELKPPAIRGGGD